MRRSYVILALVVSLAGAALLIRYGPSLRTFLEVGLLAGTLFSEIVKRTPALYLRWKRSQFYIANTAATWDLAVRFETPRLDGDLVGLTQDLLKWSGDGAVISQDQRRTVFRIMRRFVVELSSPLPATPGSGVDSGREVDLSISPVTIGYRDSQKFIDDELMPLIERVRNAIGAEWASYTLRVDLPEANPYFGLYLQTFRSGAIQDFRLQLAVPAREKTAKILVSRDRMTVIAESLVQFRTAIRAALAFRVPEG